MTVEYQSLLLETSKGYDDSEKTGNRRWTKLEKILSVIAIASTITFFVIVVVIASPRYVFRKDTECVSSNSSNVDVCLTPACIKTASEVLASLDTSIDPCNDFYRFACGGWLKTHPIPEDRSSVSVFSEVNHKMDLDLRVLLEEKRNPSDPHFIRMLHEVYDRCMDLKTIDNLGSEPLKKILKTLGGWPAVEGSKWNDSKFDWIEAVMAFRKIGFSHNIFLATYISVDSKNNTINRINLDEATLGMPDRTFYLNGLNDTITAAYFNLMVQSAKLLGADKMTVETELLEALLFETALAKFSLPREEKRLVMKIYNEYTIRELQRMAPQVPWLKYLRALVNESISENETLNVAVPDFVVKFADLITTTDKRIIANYMLWRAVKESMPYLSKEWRYMNHEYSSAVTGKMKETSRWQHCLYILNGGLHTAASSYYIRHYFKEESRKAALEIFNYTLKEFLNALDSIDWMDRGTKEEAKAKAKYMTPHIGHPKELLNDTVINEFYEDLTIPNDSYFNNVLKISQWAKEYSFSQLRKPNIKGEWKKYTKQVVVNAFYEPSENGVELPAGILRNEMFNKDRPKYMNFGSIGYILGHEITHGFDDIGRHFDKYGNMVNWWDNTTAEHFRKKAQCIIDKYSNYTTEDGLKINGERSQGENMADIGGLKLSYEAYHSWVKENGQEKQLPGLNYSSEQMFFISTAKTYCENIRPKTLRIIITTEEHCPNNFRILGVLSNFKDFATVFKCPHDSPMNRRNRCYLW